MSANSTPLKLEESLDPQDWEALRELAHRMIDDVIEYHRTVRERPVWEPLSPQERETMNAPLPVDSSDPADVYDEFARDILSNPMGNIHPRFWGWVIGTGSTSGALAEMLAATINPNVGGGDQIASLVEKQVIDWFKQILGYPETASGVLVSGGSLANQTALQVARYVTARNAGVDVRKQGMINAPRYRIYCSAETHSSVERSMDALGFGSDSINSIPVDDQYRIDIAALEAAIAADRAAGLTPFCVIGTAGTTNTGSVDDLNALADICEREKLWFHVDGAVGAVGAMSAALRPLLAGMERADSIAFDLHKWMYLTIGIGCVLVRNGKDHYRTYTLTPDYLKHGTRGLSGGDLWYSDYSAELSRPYRALEVWMLLKEHGVGKYGRMMEQNVDQARYLADLVNASPKLELLAAPQLMITCFRYRAGGIDDATLDKVNEEMLFRVQEAGIAIPSGTRLHGKYAIRVCIVNHRTRREDLDLLVREVIRIGDEIVRSL
ncbi:MAG: aminotransferase class V-fold PLP-dependent enzyme [Anaerolineae bacterium]|nr:aminotransferase class V-fold PLP-dependent enzyme [Anaerolineae bacterium]